MPSTGQFWSGLCSSYRAFGGTNPPICLFVYLFIHSFLFYSYYDFLINLIWKVVSESVFTVRNESLKARGGGEPDYKWETSFGFNFIQMLPVRCNTSVCYVVRYFTMTSPYFTESNCVVTRSGSQRAAGCTPASSLRSRITDTPRNQDPASSAAVKVEEEEATVSGMFTLGPCWTYLGRPCRFKLLGFVFSCWTCWGWTEAPSPSLRLTEQNNNKKKYLHITGPVSYWCKQW